MAPHLHSMIETQRIMCCKKLASDEPSSWKIILLHYLKPIGGTDLSFVVITTLKSCR